MSFLVNTSNGHAAPPSPAADPEFAPATNAPDGGAVTSARTLPGLVAPTQRRRSVKPIGQVIVDLGFARREAVEQAVVAARAQGKTTGQMLLEMGAIRDDQLARALAERLGIDYIDLSSFEVDSAALDMIDGDTARRYVSVPVGVLPDGALVVAMADPTNVVTLDELSLITGRRIIPAVAARQDMAPLIGRYTQLGEPEPQPEVEREPVEIELSKQNLDAPAVKLVSQVVGFAVERGASDIHFNPQDGELQVYMRVDGVLLPATTVSRALAGSVVSRIKIMAGIDIAEKRVPQDGRARITVENRSVDLRVASLPLVGGEGIVMRILDGGTVVRELQSLGMNDLEFDSFSEALSRPYGAVLVTGPTGSGKSTTLYGGLSMINDGDRSILTIEDPVESPLRGIKQMQVNVKSGLTFAAGLRSILRADPDVIMVGEIRDRETAEIAIQAALTGHLMLSTLHTRDAPSAITRLMDMGVEPFMIAAALDCVVAQRLARTLCRYCKQPAQLTDAVRAEHGLEDAEVFAPVGCGHCGGSGYAGRIGLYEVLRVTDEIRTLMMDRGTIDQLNAAARRAGMRTMRQDGIEKVRQGLTSLVEVTRVTSTV